MTGVLQDYLNRSQLAEQLGVCERTIARYEALPDGLPSVKLGGRKLYRIEAVRDWIAAREVRPNPTRRRAA